MKLLGNNKQEPATFDPKSKVIKIEKTFGDTKSHIELPVNNWIVLDVDEISYWFVDPEIF